MLDDVKTTAGLMSRTGCAFPLWTGRVREVDGDIGVFCNEPVTVRLDGTPDSYCLPCRLRMLDTRLRETYALQHQTMLSRGV